MLCIGIAFIFWLVTKLSYSYRNTILVKVEYDVPDDKTLSESVPSVLEVDIQAAGWDLLDVTPPVLSLHISDEKTDVLSTSLLEGKLRTVLPNGAQILHIRPDHLPIRVEDRASKRIPVVLDNRIELAPQYSFADSPSVVPSEIQVTGPASVIRDMQYWQTVPLIAQNVRQSIQQPIALRPHTNNNIHFTPSVVECVANVEQVTEKKLELPVQILNVPDSLLVVIIPQRIHITCLVGLSDYYRLNISEFRAVADFKDRTPNENTLRIRLERKPAYVHYVQFAPKKVDYIIRTIK